MEMGNTGYAQYLQSRLEQQKAVEVSSTRRRRQLKLSYLGGQDTVNGDNTLNPHWGIIVVKKKLKSYFT